MNKWLGKKVYNNENEDVIKKLTEENSTVLRLATIEALELANWMRRLVKSESDDSQQEC